MLAFQVALLLLMWISKNIIFLIGWDHVKAHWMIKYVYFKIKKDIDAKESKTRRIKKTRELGNKRNI